MAMADTNRIFKGGTPPKSGPGGKSGTKPVIGQTAGKASRARVGLDYGKTADTTSVFPKAKKN